ncbi:MAG: flagellin domain protein, partial [Micrococcaceae bacterium]|nr:flagellin domain protein [Micrococcaceae bacterium]
MGMQVNTNLAANNAYRNLNNNQTALNKSLEKLSSGLRINRAGDDAAGLAISEGLKSQVGGLAVAARNAQDGINVVQTAEGGLSQTQAILQRLRDLAVQAGNDSNNADSRTAIKTESDSLVKEIGRISESTNFGGTKLLDGTKGNMSFQVGANGDAASQINVDLNSTGMSVAAIHSTLNGNAGSTGTQFNLTDPTDLSTLKAEKYTFTSVKDGVTTSVETAVLNDKIAGASSSQAGAGFESVDEFAGALNADAKFAEKFTAAVVKDKNGAGMGIVVTAKDGGQVQKGVEAAGTTAPGSGLDVAAAAGGASGAPALDFSTASSAQDAIKLLDTQIKNVSTARSTLGATQNRLESAVQTISISKENLSASQSRITDTDMAEEMVSYTRSSILSQAGTAMLAQANQSN